MKQGDMVRVWLPFCAGLVGLGYVFQYSPGPHNLTRWIGLGLGLTGLAGVILARYARGRSFSVAARATELVTSGIYSRVRNPIYVAGMVFLVGLLLMWHRAGGAHPHADHPGPPGSARARGEVRQRLSRIPCPHLVLREPRATGFELRSNPCDSG